MVQTKQKDRKRNLSERLENKKQRHYRYLRLKIEEEESEKEVNYFLKECRNET